MLRLAHAREPFLMEREPIVFVGTSDLSGHFRGKSFPATELPARLQRGVGLAPTNLFLSAFGPIQVTPFGTPGEVLLIPDAATRVYVPFPEGAPEYFFIGDLLTLEREPWSFCPRQVLRRSLERLARESGLTLLASFEQEFLYSGVAERPHAPYSLSALRRVGTFGEELLAVMRQAGVVPDSFLAEYGPCQYEVTQAPARGVRAADEALMVRELAQAVAFRRGQRVSFAPIRDPEGTGNGAHIHFSLLDEREQPILFDPECPWQLSARGAQFVAGVLHHLPGLCAISCPGVASYYRLRPNRWAPVRADIGVLDRGTAVRICAPARGEAAQQARQFNVEFRVADCTANPYLVLAMLVQAGLDGLRQRRAIGPPAAAPALPTTLAEALRLLESSTCIAEWLGPELLQGYLLFKRAELESLQHLDEAEVCRRYADVY